MPQEEALPTKCGSKQKERKNERPKDRKNKRTKERKNERTKERKKVQHEKGKESKKRPLTMAASVSAIDSSLSPSDPYACSQMYRHRRLLGLCHIFIGCGCEFDEFMRRLVVVVAGVDSEGESANSMPDHTMAREGERLPSVNIQKVVINLQDQKKGKEEKVTRRPVLSQVGQTRRTLKLKVAKGDSCPLTFFTIPGLLPLDQIINSTALNIRNLSVVTIRIKHRGVGFVVFDFAARILVGSVIAVEVWVVDHPGFGRAGQ
ncbi:hypothetical protein CPC08DRAFT_730040 [Agrocybe pediades]|nr:hypothetical protein CPC08DRAFT_730040 [Agrocybe pediades]